MIQLGLSLIIIAITALAVFYLTRRSIYQKLNKSAVAIEKALSENLTPDLYKIDPKFQSLHTATRHLFERIREGKVELEHQSEKSVVVLENLHEAVIAIGNKKQILLLNKAAERIFNTANSFIGKPLIEIVRNAQIVGLMEKALSQHSQFFETVEIIYPEHRFLNVYATAKLKDCSDIAGILVLSDITEMKRLENLRRDFVANASHEFKTPLTSIKGFTETLLGGASKSPSQNESFLKLMAEDVERLEHLIINLLDLSKAESQTFHLTPVAFHWHAEVNRIIQSFQSKANKRNIMIRNKISENFQTDLMADSDQLRRVLINLIDNAIKFNRENGQILISADKDDHSVSIQVKDTGVGVPSADLERIFERFYRVDKARSREQGGTGLGLSIVKHIVQSHSGEIFCSSVLGEGSTFNLSLPICCR